MIELVNRVLSLCSSKCLFGLARGLSFILRHTSNQISRKTRQSISLCFSDMNEQQQQQLINDSIVHTCCSFTELGLLWHQSMDRVLTRLVEQDIDESFYSANKPRIIIAPHHGSWELLNLWLAHQLDLISLYEPARTPALDRYIRHSRSRSGARLVPANTSGLRSLLQGLKQGASCMVLPDQRPGRKSAYVEADFFGIPAPTSLLVKKLLTKVDCDVFIAAATRNLQQGNYSLRIEKLESDRLKDKDRLSAGYMNQSIERFISQNICQYQWAYRRFRSRMYARG